MIRPVFANTAWVTARERLILKGGGFGRVRLRVRVGLIEHPTKGPILIDAGHGPRISEGAGRSMPLRLYSQLLRFKTNPLESPLALLADHGYLPDDVELVLLTHLHADHVGYLKDLPNARFVVDGVTHGRLREGVFGELLPSDFSRRCLMLRDYASKALPFALGQGFDVAEDGGILGVPLPGHARGHYGICFPGNRPLLYGADIQWLNKAVIENRAPGFPATLMGEGVQIGRDSISLARRFMREGGELVLCHDPAVTPYDWTPSDV